jgi:CRP-like cAMP-binding protein
MPSNLLSEFQRCFPALTEQLGPDAVDRLLKTSSVAEIPEGRRLLRDRMPVDSLYLVLDGELTVYIGEGREKIVLGHAGPGDWLGEVAILSGEMRASSTVTPDRPCRALRIHAKEFENFILHDEEIAFVLLDQLVDMLSRRLRESAASEQRLAQSVHPA